MTPEHWNKVDQVWHDVLARPEHERAAAIAELCAGNDLLRRDVESMLAHLVRANDAGFGATRDASAVLESGTHLGRFEIRASIGAGGMGEVYRAHDSRLDRDVAIKVLPPHVARDPDRLRRFEQEAQAAAALNHPNILSVHDVGSQSLQGAAGAGATDISFIVTELLEGRSLRQLLIDEKLSTLRAIELASQLADGLAAAHARNIVHRDLKPENLFITSDGRLKILDFGLAKALGSPALESSTAPTQSTTAPHVIIGTPGYMSPEQIRDEQVDHRSDIFAFGAVLYEMLTGVRAFSGKTPLDTMSAVLRESPAASLRELEPPLPVPLIRIVERCLEKSPLERFQSTTDLAFALKALTPVDLIAPQLNPARSPRRSVALLSRGLRWALPAVVAIIILVLWYPWGVSPASHESIAETTGTIATSSIAVSSPSPPDNRGLPGAPSSDSENTNLTSTLSPPPGVEINGGTVAYGPAISPDGTRVVYMARQSEAGPWQLWLHDLRSDNARPLPGTESLPAGNSRDRGPELPFWSPAGDEVAFASSHQLKRVNIDTGKVNTICDLPGSNFQGGSWGADGTIIFSSPPAPGGLQKVRQEGPSPVPLTKADEQRGERHLHPLFLPDGRHFVFQTSPERRLVVASLENPEVLTPIGWADSHVAYARGYLLYVQSQRLMAHRFDLKTLNLVGAPIPIADDVATHESTGRSTFAVSQNGRLVYRQTGRGGGGQLAWYYRSDRSVHPIQNVKPDSYIDFELLADERHVLTHIHHPDDTGSVFRVGLENDNRMQLTEGRKNHDHSAKLSPENTDEFMWLRPDENAVYLMPSTGEKRPKVFQHPTNVIVSLADWSKNWLIETMRDAKGQTDIWYAPVNDPQNPRLYESTVAIEGEARLSPDERWIAYTSASEGPDGSRVEIRSFPSNEGKWPIENSGRVMNLRFSSDGSELFFSQPDGQGISALEIKPTEHGIDFGSRQRYPIPGANLHDGFAVTRDGQKFLVLLNPNATAPKGPGVTYRVFSNWLGLLPRK